MKRSEKMTKDGKMLALAAVVVMIAASLACVVPMVSDSDSYATETTGNIVNISVGQVKQSIIAVNETAFEFDSEEDDDGIEVKYGTGSEPQFTTMVKYKYSEDSWKLDTTYAAIDSINSYKLEIVGKTSLDGKYTVQFTGKADNNEAAEKLTIRISITSQGETQSLDYNYTVNVYKSFSEKSKIIYDGTVQATAGGTFISGTPEVYYSHTDKGSADNDEMNQIDTTNFIFYATGLNKGVALYNADLSIQGSVPADKGGWSGDSMTLTFAITDKRTGYVVIIGGVTVNYSLYDAPALNYYVLYTHANGASETWSHGNGKVVDTLVSNGTLNISGSSNCVATVIYEDQNGKTTTDRITLNNNGGQSIDITGTGKMIITVSVVGSVEQTLEFTIIDDMIPVNDIGVTCGPAMP